MPVQISFLGKSCITIITYMYRAFFLHELIQYALSDVVFEKMLHHKC